jgi:hypothetical protein
MKISLVPMTKELFLLHQKRLAVPEFAKWWARYVHMKFAMESKTKSPINLQYTEKELTEVYERAFAALPPELL